MKIRIKRLYNNSQKETGAILFADVAHATTPVQKAQLEAELLHWAFHKIYPGQGLVTYSNTYSDTPSIVAIRNINDLPDEIETT